MSTYPPHTKHIRRCFFFSLAFVIVIPIICIVLGLVVHPQEFTYNLEDTLGGSTRHISLHADLVSADLKEGTVVLDWIVLSDICDSECTLVNIYFDTNLFRHPDIGGILPFGSNRPTNPIIVWNATAYYGNDVHASVAMFRTELATFSPDDDSKYPVRRTRSSDVYYPFDRHIALIYAFAEDANTNASVSLSLDSTSGLAAGLKVSPPDFITEPYNIEAGIPEHMFAIITLQRGTLVKIYCIIITMTFWLITLMMCLIMIMTVGFGFQQRNEIVVVPVGAVFAFTQLRTTMPGAPDGFSDVLDFVGVLPCLVLLSISAITMVGIYIFTDPAKDSREKLSWSALVNALAGRPEKAASSEATNNTVPPAESYSMLSLSKV
ncbi:hypothetical protein F5146DRAFT_667252 [Armillaria mellea]|nr:hypothetical protein F5146DRAFT_667252 [Armillaria mellea]